MDVIEQVIRVSFRFPVVFTAGAFETTNPLLRDLVAAGDDPCPADAVVVIDDGVVRTHAGIVGRIEGYCMAHRDAIRLAAPVLVIPGGEASKNDPQYADLIHGAIQAGALCRHSYVIAVGGGAVLDVVGYAAATAHRGIRLIRVPTTVLAQDDSAVGVKNGINAYGKKNYFGTFAPPFAVINDSTFLGTLLNRDWIGGVSEAVKAAIIKDAAFFDELETLAPALVGRDAAAMDRVVRRSAALHLSHIANGGDPFELGSSRPLDFGHWSAHKLEQLTNHRVRHGEAVAVGVALDCTYARLSGMLPEGDWQRVIDVLQALGLAVYIPELGQHLETPDDERCVLRGLGEFREHLGGRLTIMMPRAIGETFDVNEIDTGVMIRAIEILRQIEQSRQDPAKPGPAMKPGRRAANGDLAGAGTAPKA
jgi:3-dehydroquinate synthase